VTVTPTLAQRAVDKDDRCVLDGLDVRSWEVRVAAVAACAGLHATRIDAAASFPAEAVEAMRAEGLLGAWIDPSLGGLGVSIEQIAWACGEIGQRCASSAMVFAMHQIQVASLVRHTGDSDWWTARLREIASTQRLIASATSEVGVGGDLRSSSCALQVDGPVGTLTKQAPVISYGLEADDILATARRCEDAPPGDQQLVLLRRTEYALEQTSRWEALGMRGTCSHGFTLKARFTSDAVVPEAFARIATDTMVPVSHLLWASVWLGMATDAVRRARTSAREDARRTGRANGNPRLAHLVARLHAFRGVVHEELREFSARMDDPDALGTMGYAIRVNNLKVNASEALVEIVQGAMLVAGIAGYRTDTPVTLGRSLRDALGALVMINNDRIVAANASLLLASRED
jgi:acyl-CoA dehydrogenase